MFREARGSRDQGVRHKRYSNYAIALATTLIVEMIANDLHAVAPVSVLIDGYFGVKDVCLSMPCVIGRAGVTKVLPVELNQREVNAFRESAQVLRGVIRKLERR